MDEYVVPISSVQLINVENIPLSLCCISGIALVLNFVQCPLNCNACIWESNLSIRSATVVNIDSSILVQLVRRYNPDIVFFHGGEPWRYKYTLELLSSLRELDALKGMKINSSSVYHHNMKDLLDVIKLVDVVLIEVNNGNNNLEEFLDLVERIYGIKHMEFVMIYDTCSYEYMETLVDWLLKLDISVPINVSLIGANNVGNAYNVVSYLRKRYPVIQLIHSKVSEYSSTLCMRCRLPVVVREGARVIKLALDSECRCKYCGYRVIKVEKNVCRVRKIYRVPVRLSVM